MSAANDANRMALDFSRCRSVWVPDESEAGGFWSPLPAHARIGVERIVTHPWFLLADDMGLLKTAQAINAAMFLFEANAIDRVIVVAPSELRSKVWFEEDFGQLKDQLWNDVRCLVSEFHQRVRSWAHGPKVGKELRWIVTNYEFIRNRSNLGVLLPYCSPRTLLVLDESSAVRTWDSAQTEACMLLRWKANAKGHPVLGAPRCGRVLLLNGTPIAESPMDVFSQANLMHPSILECRYVTHYKARYAVQVPVLGGNGKPMVSPYMKRERQADGSYKKVPQHVMTIAPGPAGWTNLEDLAARMAPYVLRREAKEVGIDFALPPVGLEVRLTDPTWKIYRQMRDEMVAWLESGVATARQAGVKVLRLAQITSGFLGGVEDVIQGEVPDIWFDGSGEPTAGDAILDQPTSRTIEVGREKLDFVLAWHAELLRKHPDLKLAAWFRFVPELKRFLREERLAFPSIPAGALCGEKVFDGEHSKRDERDFAVELFNPKTAPAGAATVGATQGTGAMGLNFTSCRTVIDVSYDFSPWKKKQGDARFNRTGQTGPVSFFYLVAVGPKNQRTIDHHVMLTRLGKAAVNDWTTDRWATRLAKVLKEE